MKKFHHIIANMKQRTKKILAGLLIAAGVLGIVCEMILIITYDQYLSFEWAYPETRWNFLAFFTQITNITVDIWMILVGVSVLFNRAKLYKFLTKPQIQGALSLYILVVGAIYCGVLLPISRDLYSAAYWWGNVINAWHHLVVPVGMVVLWCVMPHEGRLKKRTMWFWMIYPIAYLLFSEIRGLVVGWYPYPFLDPKSGPLFPIGLVSLTSVFIILGFAFIWYHNRRAKKQALQTEEPAQIKQEQNV